MVQRRPMAHQVEESMKQDDAHYRLCEVDDAFILAVGHCPSHVYKEGMLDLLQYGYVYNRAAVPWPTKWGNRSKLFTLKTF